jgi:hypothetical protein
VEKIKVVLLAGIFCVLCWMASHPRPQVGRFTAPDAVGSGTDAGVPLFENDLLLDTATGQPCVVPWAEKQYEASTATAGRKRSEYIRPCSELK